MAPVGPGIELFISRYHITCALVKKLILHFLYRENVPMMGNLCPLLGKCYLFYFAIQLGFMNSLLGNFRAFWARLQHLS